MNIRVYGQAALRALRKPSVSSAEAQGHAVKQAGRRGLIRGAGALAMLGGLTFAGAAAAAFPERPVTLVVPFAPGGGTDSISRLLAEGMGQALGKTVVVENRPGAGTVIGTNQVARSQPDGYNLVMATFAHAVNPALNKELPFDAERDFTPISLVATSPNVLVVNPNSPFKSVAELLDYARKNPGKLNYGSFGNGTSAHLAAELFNLLAKVDITHVPYKGSAPAMTDLRAGRIDLMFTTAASVASMLKSGHLRGLAVTSAKRSDVFPDLPPLAEAGVPGYAAESWYGIYAPAGTPADVVSVLNQAIRKAASSKTFLERTSGEGLMIEAGEPSKLADYVSAEKKRWAEVVKEAKLTLN